MKIENADLLGLLIIPRQEFDSYKEIDKLIRYITRTKTDGYNRKTDLIYFGGRAVEFSGKIEKVINQFKQVQGIYEKGFDRWSRHCFHEIFSFNPELKQYLTKDMLIQMAKGMSDFYYEKGFQVVYAIHNPDYNENNVHIHFAVNSISFANGLKWHSGRRDWVKRQRFFREVVKSVFNQFQEKM